MSTSTKSESNDDDDDEDDDARSDHSSGHNSFDDDSNDGDARNYADYISDVDTEEPLIEEPTTSETESDSVSNFGGKRYMSNLELANFILSQ